MHFPLNSPPYIAPIIFNNFHLLTKPLCNVTMCPKGKCGDRIIFHNYSMKSLSYLPKVFLSKLTFTWLLMSELAFESWLYFALTKFSLVIFHVLIFCNFSIIKNKNFSQMTKVVERVGGGGKIWLLLIKGGKQISDFCWLSCHPSILADVLCEQPLMWK